MKTTRTFRIDVDLAERFSRVTDALMVNGSEAIRQMMKKYVEEKEEELKVKVESVIEMRDNFPNDGEAYVVGKAENGKYFFAWGPEYPYAEEIPGYNIPDGENGISWHATEKQAMAELQEAVEAWDVK
ncbi:hypothetical protein [Heyndrickxia coagulans]|uniref:hypothetical protein n=1 Tax=Heyndrickxia coagulans TaxID=1398 RepID=UPI00062893FE|nr:hypothetical protein [Heyndrickxia coagulans]